MTVGEYAKLNAKIATLKEIATDYSGKTINNVIQQLEAIRKEVSNDQSIQHQALRSGTNIRFGLLL